MILNFKDFIFEMAFRKGNLDNSNVYLNNQIVPNYSEIDKSFKTLEIDDEEIIFDLLSNSLKNNQFSFVPNNVTNAWIEYKLILTDFDKNKQYEELLSKNKTNSIKNYILEPILWDVYPNKNSIGVPELPSPLRGMGLGKIMYEKFIKVVGYVYTSRDSSKFAQNVWKKLIYNKDLICFFVSDMSLFVLDKEKVNNYTFTLNFLKILFNTIIKEVNNLEEIEFDSQAKKLINQYKSEFLKYATFEQLFKELKNLKKI